MHLLIDTPQDVFTDPMDFKPERFLRPDGTLNPDIRDPRDVIFGIGRRYDELYQQKSPSFNH